MILFYFKILIKNSTFTLCKREISNLLLLTIMTKIELVKDNYGAINAIRGYRTQFLYSLYRILRDREQNLIFEPEVV